MRHGNPRRAARVAAQPGRAETDRGLDPDDEDERTFLLEAQHPDMEEAPEHHEEMTGPDGQPMKPRLHVTLHLVVANQLLADDPSGDSVATGANRRYGEGASRPVRLKECQAREIKL
jgi:hypothetical protein